MSVGIYWKNVLLYLCMFVFSWALTDGILLSLALPKPEEGYLEWSLYALVSSLLFLSILTILFYNFQRYSDFAGAIYSLVTFEYKTDL